MRTLLPKDIAKLAPTLAVILACAVSCAPATPPVRSTPGAESRATTSSRTERLGCPFEDDAPVHRVAQWAVACENMRQTAPATSGTAVLLYTDARSTLDQPSTEKHCIGDASSLLSGGGRVFLVKSSKLYELELSSGKISPVEVHGVASGWRYSQLLAFSRRTPPLTLLVSMVRGRGAESEIGVWRLALEGQRFLATPVADDELPGDARAFQAAYITPRCAQGLEQCLVIANRTLGIKPRGRPTTSSQKSPGGWVLLDAVWLRPEQGARDMLLLAAGVCPTSAFVDDASRTPASQ